MPKMKDNIIRMFNRIFRRNNFPMIASVSKQNYDEYHTTYDTLSKIFGELDDIDAYLVGGISSAIQTNQDLYRQNSDIDIMCKEEDLPKIIKRLQEIGYSRVIIEHPEINSLINEWQEKTKHYTYRDKIRLINIDYSQKLQGFDKKAIDNALDFLQRRHQNHGKNNDDIELDPEASKIFELMTEYGQSIKRIFVDNNIDITHITSIAPEKLEGGVLRKSIDRANNYETERVNGVFASSSPIDGNNPYIARNSSGMIILGKSTYIYGNDNIEVTQDSEGKKHAMLRKSNYIYHINPDRFNPVCNLTIDSRSHEPIFEFSEEWISDSEIDILDHSQVRSIEQVKDVTSLLEHYTILCDTQSQGIGMKARHSKTKDEALKFIATKIKDGSVRNINQETGINDRDLSSTER